MTKDEMRFNCIRVAYEILDTGGSAAYTAEGKPDKLSVEDVLSEAKKLYEWVSGSD